jgi:hypothetical protein
MWSANRKPLPTKDNTDTMNTRTYIHAPMEFQNHDPRVKGVEHNIRRISSPTVIKNVQLQLISFLLHELNFTQFFQQIHNYTSK